MDQNKEDKTTKIISTRDLLEKMKISKNIIGDKERNFLLEKGYLILNPPEFIKKNLKKLNEVIKNLIKKEGNDGGWEGKEQYYKKDKPFESGATRLGNLIEKDSLFKKIITIPEILLLAHEVIKDDFKISGLNFRNPKKNMGEQSYHIDILPRLKESDKYTGIVCAIFLDDSKIENGATRLIPGTHKILGWPDEHIDTKKLHKKEIRATLRAGSILIFNLNLWHAGAKNISGEDRKVIFLQIKNRKEPQLLNYKKYLSKKTKKELNQFEKYLLAVREEDPDQSEDSYSVGKHYRKKFNQDRA